MPHIQKPSGSPAAGPLLWPLDAAPQHMVAPALLPPLGEWGGGRAQPGPGSGCRAEPWAASALGGTAARAPLSSFGLPGWALSSRGGPRPTPCSAAPAPGPSHPTFGSPRPFLAPETDWTGRRRGWSPAPPQSGLETSKRWGVLAPPHRQARPAARRPRQPPVLPTTRPSRPVPSVVTRPPLPVIWPRDSGQSPGSGGPHGDSRAGAACPLIT